MMKRSKFSHFELRDRVMVRRRKKDRYEYRVVGAIPPLGEFAQVIQHMSQESALKEAMVWKKEKFGRKLRPRFIRV